MRFLINHIIELFILILLLTSSCERIDVPPKEDFTGMTDTTFDQEGNSYKVVGIGTQIWMAENLRSTRLNNGKDLPNIRNDSAWSLCKVPAYCFYNHDSTHFSKTYGALYNYHVVSTDSICPYGWHVPTEKDWDILTQYLGGKQVAGGKLKAINGNYWSSPNYLISNTFNFDAVAGGFRDFDTNLLYDTNNEFGFFLDFGKKGYWWTKNNLLSSDNWIFPVISMSNEKTHISKNTRYINVGASIRCIKNN
jgi:uncharacterized protein (TIGR02145 family)